MSLSDCHGGSSSGNAHCRGRGSGSPSLGSIQARAVRCVSVGSFQRFSLFKATHQVALAVTLVDEVSRVSSTFVSHGKPEPAVFLAVVLSHEAGEILYVHVVRRQARRRSEGFLQRQDELVKLIRVDLGSQRSAAQWHAVDDFDGHVDVWDDGDATLWRWL